MLGGRLAARPAETVEALRRTPHGCDWMIERWALLASAARVDNTWTPEQTRLAFDLLGTPSEFRTGRKPGSTIDVFGNEIESGDDLVAVANRQVTELLERREVVAGLDEVERALTEADLTNDADPELRRIRRYEAGLHRRLHWYMAQLNYISIYKGPDPSLRPRWVVEVEPMPEDRAHPRGEGDGKPPGRLVRGSVRPSARGIPADRRPARLPGDREVAEAKAARTGRGASPSPSTQPGTPGGPDGPSLFLNPVFETIGPHLEGGQRPRRAPTERSRPFRSRFEHDRDPKTGPDRPAIEANLRVRRTRPAVSAERSHPRERNEVAVGWRRASGEAHRHWPRWWASLEAHGFGVPNLLAPIAIEKPGGYCRPDPRERSTRTIAKSRKG